MQQSNRIAYIDALRGFAIFLVVLGHIFVFSMRYNRIGSTFVMSMITIVHMPIFFFISGYLLNSFKDFGIGKLGSKVKQLLIPATLFLAVWSIYKHQNMLVTILQKGYTVYWFNVALFEMFAMYYLLKAFFSKAVRFFDVTLVALIVISLAALPLHYDDIAICKTLEIAKFVEYLPFFLFGLLCGRHREKFCAFLRNDYVRAGLILSFIVLGFLRFNGVLNEDSAFFKVIDYYLIRWNAVVVLFMIFDSVRDYFQQTTSISRSLQFVGRRTLDIYLIHYFFLPDLTSWGPRFAGSQSLARTSL